MKKQQIKWFTLVELIIVITILAILWTMAFVYFNWYSSNARDATRLTDMSNIWKALSLNVIQSWMVPLPDNSIQVKSDWIITWYQWDLWKTTSQVLKISWNIKDPLTGDNYTYFSNSNLSNWQVVAFLESWNESSDYKQKKILYWWEPIWLILDTDNNPINKNSSVISQWYFDTLTWAYATWDIKVVFNSTPYTYKPFIVWGQLLQMSKWKSFNAPTRCPINFIPVPWNKDLWQPWFCAWKYEASWENLTWSTLLTKPGTIPANNFDYAVYLTWLCQWNWAGYHNMTLMERITIARNIENQSKNWSSWIVWSGYIFTWNSGDSYTGFSTWVFLKTWPIWNNSIDQLRQLYLSNWEFIQDFIWNYWEVVSPLNFADWSNEYYILSIEKSYLKNNFLIPYSWTWFTKWSYINWSNISNDNFLNLFWPSGTNLTSSGIWKFKEDTTSNYIYLEWWDYSWIWENWLYSMYRVYTTLAPNITIRCSFTP